MTKVIEISELVRFCEQKRETGDYLTLSKALRTTVDAVRMRVKRRDEDALRALYTIIVERERVVQQFHANESETEDVTA